MNMKRMDSRKTHSWWWDSHISPKNSRWLGENLEEMDQSVKRMLKLIEEDGDSFAKKAEMYYRRRPDLISHVEEFYRMYRSLADRYDHLTGELRKNIPSDLQSQCSGISDLSSERPSSLPSPDLRIARRKSGQQAAGFDFFLSCGGSNSDGFHKEGDESSSLTDSEPECDSSSVNNYLGYSGNGADHGLQLRVIELESELRDLKEKVRMQMEESTIVKTDASEEFQPVISKHENELKIANNKVRLCEEEISQLQLQLQRYGSNEFVNVMLHEFQETQKEEDVKMEDVGLDACKMKALQNPNQNGQVLMEEIKMLREKLQDANSEIASLRKDLENGRSSEKDRLLQDKLDLAQKDAAVWKTKYDSEKREVSKLLERMARLKSSLSGRDQEIRELKTAVSDAEEKIFPEKCQIKAEISRLLEVRTHMEEQLKEEESRGRSLEEEIRKLKVENIATEERLNKVIEQLKAEVAAGADCMESLKRSYDMLLSERNGLHAETLMLQEEIGSKNGQIDQLVRQLEKLKMEHVELIAISEGLRTEAGELRSRAKALEEEIERLGCLIFESAEQKREAIRQLCFSLEYYRSDYHKLRHAVVKHKKYRHTS